MDATPERPLFYRIPSALLVPALGAAGYAVAHSFESGYLHYFGLPPTMVRVSINTAIVATGSLLSVVAVAFYMTWFLSSGLRDERGRYAGPVEVLLALAIFGVFIYERLFEPSWKVRIAYVVAIPIHAALISAGANAMREWLARRREKQTRQQPVPSTPINPWVAVAPFIGWDAVTLATLLLGANALASLVGTINAKRAVDFLTLDDPSGYVVLRVYDDAVITASLNRTDRTVGPEIRILSPDRVSAKREAVGPLKPVRVPGR